MTPETDDDGAARWAIRLDAHELTAEGQAELDAWLAESERRAGALLRAQAALSYLDRGRALGANRLDEESEIKGGQKRWRLERRSVLGTLVGGGLAAALAGFLLMPPRAQEIDTDIGEVRKVALTDGSNATVNTDSRIEVVMEPEHRTVRLKTGEAWFKVAHDKARPFVVEAGDIRVRAVGTAFSVRRRGSGADVLVTEGSVETWVVGRESLKQQITAGSRGFVSDEAPAIEVSAAPIEVERALSWRSGELALDGETLGYAVQEINRYNKRKIVIEDPEIAHVQLVGFFRMSEPEKFGRAVASMADAKVISDGDKIRLVRATD